MFYRKHGGRINKHNIKQVDYIHNIANIHHLSDWEETLKIFYRILVPGGYVMIAWVEPTMGWRFLVKNKICYYFSSDPKKRIWLGAKLFGWLDNRYNPKKASLEVRQADQYAAFYHVITIGMMRRALLNIGFEIVEYDPPTNIDDWLKVRLQSKNKNRISFLISPKSCNIKYVFTLLLRLYQSLFYGALRTIVIKKPMVR